MKIFITIFALLSGIILASPKVHAQYDGAGWVSGGVTYGQILGNGEKENFFNPGFGAKLELGVNGERWGYAFYMIGGQVMENQVGESIISSVYIQQLFFEPRFLIPYKNKKWVSYLSAGLGMGSLKIEDIEGWDHQFNIQMGAGTQVFFVKWMLEIYAKPYYIRGNQLGQDWGYTAGLLIGHCWDR